MSDRLSGTVKWFNDQKGFGFITPDNGGEDLFVHQSSIRTDGFRTLGDGEAVEFQIESDSDGRTKAVDVTGPEEGPVQGRGSGGGGRGGGGRGGGGGGRGGRGGGGYGGGGYGGGGGGYGGGGGGYGGGGGGGNCFKCGEAGHMARDCTEGGGGYGGGGGGRYSGGGGGGGRYSGGGGGGGASGGGCFQCGESGHFARECPNRN
ncbi:hypothetical protein M0R45_007318 [Rubus argutus]|uniref:Uncharacterized protein n=1 Tax=Rubus argutus TaxID=59490 RepID=A0AAW1XYU1_RUBAR